MGKFFKLAKEIDQTPDPITTVKEKLISKNTLIDLGAGAAAGAISGLIVAPLSAVADIAGSSSVDKNSNYYGMSNKEIAKTLWREGADTAEQAGKNRIWGGVRGFYKGQGMKALKIAPQNAVNLALFSLLTGIGASMLVNKAHKKEVV